MCRACQSQVRRPPWPQPCQSKRQCCLRQRQWCLQQRLWRRWTKRWWPQPSRSPWRHLRCPSNPCRFRRRRLHRSRWRRLFWGKIFTANQTSFLKNVWKILLEKGRRWLSISFWKRFGDTALPETKRCSIATRSLDVVPSLFVSHPCFWRWSLWSQPHQRQMQRKLEMKPREARDVAKSQSYDY